jgi:hypothetical protein
VNFPIAARQPFVGLALAAMLGIVLADFFPLSPSVWLPIGTIFVIAGWAAFHWPNLRSTYALVACGFFLLHNLQIEDTAGLRLAGQLGERPRAVGATGLVVSEPKIASNGFATFLLKLKSIEFERKNRPTSATWLVRWRGEPEFGDEFKFFGIAEPIPPPRNPGEFDMRSYLARPRRAPKFVCSLSGGRRAHSTWRRKSGFTRCAKITRVDADCALLWVG